MSSTDESISSTPTIDSTTTVDCVKVKEDPFEFGKRFLKEDDDVFSHNAWDHVQWGEEQVSWAEEMISKQREHPVGDFDKKLFNSNPAKYWDVFYKHNAENFFKDRNWLHKEFPELYEATAEGNTTETTILEIGCGAGNTFFPILGQNKNPNLRIFACDYSKVAVDLIKENEIFQKESKNKIAFASVWDLANEANEIPQDMKLNEADIVIMIFVFSALAPNQWQQAVNNLKKVCKPGCRILFRDYGRYDLAQCRFKKSRLLEDNFYVRGDGTRVYFFTEDELRDIFCKNGLIEEKIAVDRRLLVNRKKQLKMYRVWLQAVFKVPELEA